MSYEEGGYVRYLTFGGGTRTVRVMEKHDDVKNGRPGFSGYVVDPDTLKEVGDPFNVWGYDDQIIEVVG